MKKGDTVQVIQGKDKGKKGKILMVLLAKKRAIVEGINLMKKHKRPTRQDQKGGIVSSEAPISLFNLMIVCKQCNRPTRVGTAILQDKTKARICRKCKEVI